MNVIARLKSDKCDQRSEIPIETLQAAKKSLANHTSIAELIKEVIDAEEFGQTLATQQTFYCLGQSSRGDPFLTI